MGWSPAPLPCTPSPCWVGWSGPSPVTMIVAATEGGGLARQTLAGTWQGWEGVPWPRAEGVMRAVWVVTTTSLWLLGHAAGVCQ